MPLAIYAVVALAVQGASGARTAALDGSPRQPLAGAPTGGADGRALGVVTELLRSSSCDGSGQGVPLGERGGPIVPDYVASAAVANYRGALRQVGEQNTPPSESSQKESLTRPLKVGLLPLPEEVTSMAKALVKTDPEPSSADLPGSALASGREDEGSAFLKRAHGDRVVVPVEVSRFLRQQLEDLTRGAVESLARKYIPHLSDPGLTKLVLADRLIAVLEASVPVRTLSGMVGLGRVAFFSEACHYLGIFARRLPLHRLLRHQKRQDLRNLATRLGVSSKERTSKWELWNCMEDILKEDESKWSEVYDFAGLGKGSTSEPGRFGARLFAECPRALGEEILALDFPEHFPDSRRRPLKRRRRFPV